MEADVQKDLKSSDLNQRSSIYQASKEAGTVEVHGYWECGLGEWLRQLREGREQD